MINYTGRQKITLASVIPSGRYEGGLGGLCPPD